MARNFLLIASNIIERDYLRDDFDGLKIFFQDTILNLQHHTQRPNHHPLCVFA